MLSSALAAFLVAAAPARAFSAAEPLLLRRDGIDSRSDAFETQGRSEDANIVERVLAVVDNQPVLLSEVRAAERVRGEDEAQALESVIDEMLMFADASRLSQAALSEAEEASALESLRAGHGDDVDPDALRRMARRQATILKYVDFRFRPQVRITPEDVEKALRASPGAANPPGGVEDTEARAVREAETRRRLEAEDVDRRIEAWVAELRRAASVRYNARGR
jgi:hypothetical protein